MLLNCCCCYCDDTNNESRDQAARTNWTEDVTLYYPLSTFRREGFAKLENEAAASQPASLPASIRLYHTVTVCQSRRGCLAICCSPEHVVQSHKNIEIVPSSFLKKISIFLLLSVGVGGGGGNNAKRRTILLNAVVLYT
jgi:hypothetical protein